MRIFLQNTIQYLRRKYSAVFCVFFSGTIIALSFVFFYIHTAHALSWHQTTTVASGDAKDTAIAIASDGTIGMAWYDVTAKALKYASSRSDCVSAGNWMDCVGSAGNWTVETVDDDTGSYDAGEHPVLAFHGITPGILYYQRTNTSGNFVNAVRYAVRDNSGRGGCGNNATSAWACEVTDTSGIFGDGTYYSLTYNANGQAQAAWPLYIGGLQYAIRDGVGGCQGSAQWRCTTASPDTAIQSPILASGLEGQLFIAYKSTSGLKLSSCTSNCTQSGNWSTVALSNNQNIGAFTDVKAFGTAMHIASFNSTTGDIVYYGCANNCAVAGNWSSAVIVDAHSDQFSAGLALALTSSGAPRIVYNKSGAIGYASCNGNCTEQGNWSLEQGPEAKGSRPGIFIDAQGNANVSFVRSYGAMAYALSATNIPPTVNNIQASGTGLGQATNGSGYLTFSFQVNDGDGNPLKAKIEYSDNGGVTWYKPVLVAGSSIDNNRAYQIDPIVAGATTQATWDTKNAANGHGAITTNVSTITVRVVVNDGIADTITPATTTTSIDNAPPTSFTNFAAGTPTAFSIPLTWTAVQDDRFDHYVVWYGKNESDVLHRAGTAKQWTVADDPNFVRATTTGTMITGLTVNTKYYFNIWAVDGFGNETAVAGDITATTATTTGGRAEKVWTFSDNKTAVSQIFSRTDQAYKNYIAYVETQCRQIAKSRFFWSGNYQDDSATNWQNFGVPDCSGAQGVQPNGQITQQPEQPVSTTIQHTWIFSDNTNTTAQIMIRNDSAYLDYITSIDVQCSKITKAQWQKGSQWKENASDASTTNWQNFGIPDCSGDVTSAPPQPAPVPQTTPTPAPLPQTEPQNDSMDMAGNILLLHMDEAQWDGTPKEARDASGSNHHGTPANGTAISHEGKFGNAGIFDGVNDYVDLSQGNNIGIFGSPTVSSYLPPEEYTVEAWLRPSVKGVQQIAVYSGWDGEFMLMYTAAGKFAMSVHSGPKDLNLWDGVTSNVAYDAGTWHHVVGTYSWATKTIALYVDGILAIQNPVSLQQKVIDNNYRLATATTFHPSTIGAYTGPSGRTSLWNGLIDEVAVYRRALSSTEIGARYRRGTVTVPESPTRSFVQWKDTNAADWTNGTFDDVITNGVGDAASLQLHRADATVESIALQTAQTITAVRFVSPTDGWAVGENGTILHGNGKTWELATTVPTLENLWSLALVTATDGWAVGNGGTILHWDGTAWRTVTSPVRKNLLGVAFTGTNDGWIVGQDGTILHWDGTAWGVSASGTTNMLYGVALSAPNDGWAVGNGGVILHWDGTAWKPSISPTSFGLFAMAYGPGGTAYAVGDGGTIVRLMNGVWTLVPSFTATPFLGITYQEGGSVWIIGDYGTVLESADGEQWTETSVNTSDALFTTAFAGDMQWVMGTNGTTYRINRSRIAEDGVFTSGAHDAGVVPLWEKITWSGTFPLHASVRAQFATSNTINGPWKFVGPDGTEHTSYTTPDQPLWSGHAGQRFARYRLFFSAAAGEQIPSVDALIITYSYAKDASLVAPTLFTPEAEAAVNTLPTLSWSRIPPAASYRVEVSGEVAAEPITTTETTIAFANLIFHDSPVQVTPPESAVYQWRVRAIAADGTAGAWTPYATFTIDTIAPATPNSIAPSGDALISSTPTFQWDAVPGATAYTFQLGASQTFLLSPLLQFTQTSTEFTPSFPLPNGSYTWRVRAEDAAKNQSEWTKSSFTLHTLTPAPSFVPVNFSATLVGASVQLQWEDGALGDDTYTIQVARDQQFSEIITPLTQTGVTTTALSLDVTGQSDGVYFVRAYRANEGGNGPVAVASFTIAPAPTTKNEPVVVAPQVTSASPSVPAATPAVSSPAETTPSTPSAQTATPSEAPSIPAAFPFSLLTPNAIIAETKPTFSWSTSENASVYTLHIVGEDVAFERTVTDIADTRYVFSEVLPQGRYTWNVIARTATQVQTIAGPQSLTIDTTPPPAPTLSEPNANAAIALPVALAWSPVVDNLTTVTYTVQVDGLGLNGSTFVAASASTNTLASFATTIVSDFTDAHYLITNGLVPGVTYQWRVWAKDAAGNMSAMPSPVRSFIIPLASTAPQPFLLTAPGETSSDVTPTFQWTASNGATSYTLYIQNGIGAHTVTRTYPGSNESAFTGLSYTIGGALPSGTYTWYVRATNSAGSAFSPSRLLIITTAESPAPLNTETLPVAVSELPSHSPASGLSEGMTLALTSPAIFGTDRPLLYGRVSVLDIVADALIDEQKVASVTIDSTGAFALQSPIHLTNGTHDFRLVVDGISTGGASFVVDTHALDTAVVKSVTVVRQEEGATSGAMDVTIAIDATLDVATRVVTLFDPATKQKIIETPATKGMFPVTVTRKAQEPGAHTLLLVTQDPSGNTTTQHIAYTVTNARIAYACSDGKDNDADGFIDYPSDRGCSGYDGTNEYDSLLSTLTQQSAVTAVTNAFTDTAALTLETTKRVTAQTIARTVAVAEVTDHIVQVGQPAAVRTLTTVAPIAIAVNPMTAGSLPALPGMATHAFSWLFSALGLKKKRRNPWGMVYDAITKEPIGLAIIRLFDMTKRLLATQVTDNNGRFEFLLKPGQYILAVQKTLFTFPSAIVAGKDDGDLLDVYHGEPLTVGQEGQAIQMNIPLDPEDPAKRVSASLLARLARLRTAIGKASLPLLILGTSVSIVLYAFSQTQYNLLILLVYVGFAAYHTVLLPKAMKSWGTIFDATTLAPVPLAVVSIIDPQYQRVLKTRLSDYQGRFTFLPEPGSYQLKVTKQSYQFPSKVSGTVKKYHHLYHGEPIAVTKKNAIVTADVPLDPAPTVSVAASQTLPPLPSVSSTPPAPGTAEQRPA